mgnify:CR=1 FL=1
MESARETRTFDVIVVGGGGSGLAAAASAAEHGRKVLLLEKQPALGGTTGIAVGSYTASRTALQRKAGIDDSPEAHAEDDAKFADPPIEAKNAEQLRPFFLSHAAETLDWLSGMGLVFHGPSPEPPNRVPRMHNVVPGAKAYIDALSSRFRRLGGTIDCNAEVEKLIIEGGAVRGVRASVRGHRREFMATHGVVLAAGDYANAPEMIARFKGERFAAIEGINVNSQGDGHRLVEQAGGRLVNMDVTYGPELRFVPPPESPLRILSKLPSYGTPAKLLRRLMPLIPQALFAAVSKRLVVTWQHPENSLFDDGAILVNRDGERFCDETAWPDREIAVAAQPGKVAWIVLDQHLCERYSRWPCFISTAPQIAYAYVDDYLRLRPDVAKSAQTLESVAVRCGLPVPPLKQATRNMTDGRWVVMGPVKAYFTTTEGGAAIDRLFRLLTPSGEVIPGLYAVGQNGLGGQILWGHGLHIAWAITSGRLCGQVLGSGAK